MPTCFVVGPIGDEGTPVRGHADWLLDEIIKPVFAEHFKQFDVVRSDRIAQPGMIDSQVINHVLDAELVIADLTFQNANVFYEMGLRHMEQKPIIHMFRADQVIPFDVKPYRAIPFSLEHPKHLSTARDNLKKAVEAVLAASYKVENPVTRARGYAELSKNATPELELILAEFENLKKEVQVATNTALSAQSAAQLLLGSSRLGPGGGTVTLSSVGPSVLAGTGLAMGASSAKGIAAATAGSGDNRSWNSPPEAGSVATPLVLREAEKKK